MLHMAGSRNSLRRQGGAGARASWDTESMGLQIVGVVSLSCLGAKGMGPEKCCTVINIDANFNYSLGFNRPFGADFGTLTGYCSSRVQGRAAVGSGGEAGNQHVKRVGLLTRKGGMHCNVKAAQRRASHSGLFWPNLYCACMPCTELNCYF